MRILHLEDNREDAELVRELLTSEWPECQITLVASKADYSAEIGRHGYDLILSDFSLVQFDGSEALQIARERAPDVPFIFLSGNIGEDRAIEAVRAGAQDYVLKDRVKRLTTAIRRALHESRERKRLRAIELDRERLSSTLENSPDFVGLARPDGGVLYLNRAARRMLELPDHIAPETLTLADLHPPAVNKALTTENLPAAARDGTWSGESIVQARSGRQTPVSQVIVAHRNAEGSVDYFSTVMRDLTTRKQAEALVNGQNQILEMIAGGEPLTDTLTALVRFIESQSDDMLCSILLLEEDGERLRHCVAPRLPPAYVAAVDQLPVETGTGSCGAAVHRRAPVIVADIATDPLWENYRQLALPHGLRACWSTPIYDPRHRMLGTFAAYRREPGEPGAHHRQLTDIAVHIAAICLTRYETERKLRELASILNKAGDVIVITDRHGRVTFWNASAERTLGWTAAEALGREDRDLFGPAALAEIEAARRAADEQEEWHGEVHLQNRQGQTLVMASRVTVLRDEQGRPQGRLSIATDITSRKQIEEQFFRAQRLESIGMLAAGIAHDLNNVLAPILLGAPMLRDHATDANDLRMISTLEKSAERGAALVRQILGFAHGAGGEHRLVQSKHLLRDVATFVEETFPKSIQFEDHVPSDLWPVKANPTQLHQVLLNLCVNARDAMPSGGRLVLRGENVMLDEIAASHIEGARPGAFLVFHVEDSGTGIPPDVLAHIWEPFFTTKGTDKGTGLGLSTVRGIVEGHSGFVGVNTVQGKGTVFRVYLPAVESTSASAVAGAALPPVPRGMGELVLVVDDEPSIRNMAAAMLSRHGYRVLTAADGAEAIALFAPRSKDIRVVITDLSMPHLDGAALAGVIHRLNANVKIIAVSGLSPETAGGQSTPPFVHAFLNKPFRPEVLLTMVFDLLRTPPNPPP
ncbi:MAG TPA: response regulator [Opitutus sp.]|nr:response regulator [Opitutus sp.]